MELLVPKHRRPRFNAHLEVDDLTNVPLVSGLVHVRWHLRDSLRGNARGKTERSAIKDHKVQWNYRQTIPVRLVIDKQNMLSDLWLELEVFQELYQGKERHALGRLSLNLAEYAGLGEEVNRRYLLQDSKVNSTLRLGIYLEQTSGDSDYDKPELKKAQVFGGITGLLAEGIELKKRDEEMGHLSSEVRQQDALVTSVSNELFRNSLSRRWQLLAGELDPDDVVDDIFRGGDGFIHGPDVDFQGHPLPRQRRASSRHRHATSSVSSMSSDEDLQSLKSSRNQKKSSPRKDRSRATRSHDHTADADEVARRGDAPWSASDFYGSRHKSRQNLGGKGKISRPSTGYSRRSVTEYLSADEDDQRHRSSRSSGRGSRSSWVDRLRSPSDQRRKLSRYDRAQQDADEILQGVSWFIDANRVERNAGKSREERAKRDQEVELE
ncbi:hypothetical protein PYCC9005_002898 [Savitreella phatthalungensis]